ncbi:MAG: hypothetical protein MUC83_06920 [Pirellula sp.]|nr:hypothetical protein [Pirellula sp.]
MTKRKTKQIVRFTETIAHRRMRSRLLAVLLTCCGHGAIFTAGSGTLLGQTVISSSSSAVPSTLTDVLDRAQESLSPELLPSIAVQKSKLDQAISGLEQFLSRNPAEKDNWLRFMKWDELRAELQKEIPDLLKLMQFEKNLRQNFPGLEMRPFVTFREELRAYTNTLRVSSEPEVSLPYLKDRIAKLSASISKVDLNEDIDARRDAAQTLEYLSQANQARAMIQTIQSSYSRANVRVILSNEFVQRQFSRPVSEYNPVCEVILGTNITGDSFINGSVSPQLLDNPSNASLKLTMFGNFNSDNVGFNRGVQIKTTGFANVVACETVSLTSHGLNALSDTVADADLTTQINSIYAKSKLVTKIAKKKAAQQKPLADSIAEGRMENKIRNQFHQKLSDQLAESNQKLATTDLSTLQRVGLAKPTRSSWSSSQYLSLLWKVQDGVQLAAPMSCPIDVSPNGLTVQIHESVIGNLFDPIFGGRVLKSEEAALYAAQFGELGKKIKRDNEEPWSVTMDSFYPIEVKLDDNLITIRVRLHKLEKGDQDLKQPALIQATYRPVLDDGALQLKREGEVKIEFYGKQDKGVLAVSLRGFLKTKFSEFFKEDLLDVPLKLSEKLPPEFQSLNLVSISSEAGWLQVHLN